MPDHTVRQALQAAIAQYQAGSPRAAEKLCRQVLSREPNNVDALNVLGGCLYQTGKLNEAIEVYQRIAALNPSLPEAHNNLGGCLQRNGRMVDAIAAFKTAIRLKGDFPVAKSNLAGAYFEWGKALSAGGKTAEALEAFQQAVALKPDFIEALDMIGQCLQTLENFDGAVAAFQTIIRLKPDMFEAFNNLGIALQGKGQLDEAIASFRQAIGLKPDLAQAHNNLGAALREMGQLDEAIAAHRRAIQLKPEYAAAYFNLGNALKDIGQFDEAIGLYRQAIRLTPDYAAAHNNLGNALEDIGQLDEAIAIYRQAIRLKPDGAMAHSNLVFALHYHPGYDAGMICEEARRWNQQHAEPLKKLIEPHTNDRDPDRRLRIGYVSPDFRQHCQALFTIPLLSNHDREGFEIFCYADVGRPDAVTERIRGYSHVWRSILGMTDAEVARRIREDRIDILVDLTMHMAKNRMLLFARKPPPVQAAWLAYPGTTGLSAMDYRLTDPYLDPPGLNDQFYSETTIRLPDTFWCYDPLVTEPAVNPLPAQTSGHVTFGCLNNFCKVNEPVLRLWAQVLKTIPGSRFMLLCPEGSHRQTLLDMLQREGISPDRIELIAHRPRLQYLELYHRIDVGLDTFPYNGHTTSLDSYWMGVPVVTLVGKTVVGRGGLSQLTNLGLPELIAQTPQQYVQIATALAGDLPRLAELRRTLRGRMQASPLMDAPRFARNVEAAYRQMWRNWCEQGGNSGLQCSDHTVRPSASRPLQSSPEMSRERIRQLFESAVPLHRDGDLDGAEAVYKSILDEFPNYPDALHLLGVVAHQRGENHAAIGLIQHAIDVVPNNPEYYGNLAVVWIALRRYGPAAEASRAVLRLDPKNPGAHRNLGLALWKSGDLDAAAKATHIAIELDPNSHEAYGNLGVILALQGDRQGAITAYRKALQLHPQWPETHSCLIYAMQQHEAYDQKAVYTESRNWNRLHALPLKHLIKPHRVDSSPERKLRIGWVSPDFRRHVVARCLLPVLRAFDCARFANFCYSAVDEPDEMTRAFRASADHWRDIYPLDDEAAADLIREDGIDVLIDLALHTGNNRLLLFALKPAPVQACYLGYCGTTGLDAMDFRISHPHLDPPGADLSVYSEQTALLSRSYLCYRPDEFDGPTPDVGALPAIQNGHVTFGCLHGSAKVSAGIIDLWSQVLRAVPESRMILYVPPSPRRQWLLDRFTQLGVDSNRLEFLTNVPWRAYVETFNRIDVALDTFPYNGGVSACDALWMGVPIVTLIGATPVGRMCYSMLCNLGRCEWAAQTPAQYVAVAAGLAADLPKLGEIRASLRAAMESSPIMDAASIARDLQDLLIRISGKK
jgi:predicted O-linked N-acetylglucosamine transferase (SPINDLY family)